MAFVLAYGPYQHLPGSVNVTIDKATKYSLGNEPEATIETWTINGRLFGNGAADIDGQLAALIANYSVLGRDLVLFREDGVTPSQHALLISNALGNTLRVKKLPSFPTCSGVQYVNVRDYQIVVEAELPLPGSDTIYHEFREKLSFTGGGPVVGWVQCAVGAPQQQLWRQQSTFQITQSGKAIGYLNYLPIPDPIWPAYERTHLRRIEQDSPTKVWATGTIEYPTTWEYHFESDVPLFGQPNLWP